jgi:hypothetical protein
MHPFTKVAIPSRPPARPRRNVVGSIAVHFATHSHSATRVEFSTFSARPAYEEWRAAERNVVAKVCVQRETGRV